MSNRTRAGAFLRDYVVTMRPYLLFVSGITGLAGLSLAPGVALPSLALLSTACFLSYGFGQALTDCTQIDTDTFSAPYRPLVRGTIRARDVAVVSSVGLAVVGFILIWHNRWNAVPVTLSVIGLATYTPFKRRWWGGPFYNAAIVGLLLLIGYLAGVGVGAWPGPGRMASPFPGPPVALWPTLSVVFFGYANFVLAGYFKDIEADRVAGYATLPVVFGPRVSAWVSDGFAVLAVASALVGAAITPIENLTPSIRAIAWGTVAAGIGVTIVAQTRLHRVRRDSEAYRSIEPVVHAYVLLLAGLTVLRQPAWTPFLAGFYAAFALAIRARPDRAQI